jgi:hypothetical protein
LAIQNGGTIDLGVMRHYRSVEPVYFGLTDPTTGAAYQAGVLGTNIQATVYFPDGTTHDKSTSAPALTLTLGNNGYYRLILWGEGTAGGHDVDLAQIGTCGLLIEPVANEFFGLYMQYHVRGDLDPQMAVTYVPGPSNSSLISGCISIHRWWNHEWMDFPLTATGAALGRTTVITGLTVKITDKDSASNLVVLSGLSTAGGDFSENAFDGNVYFTKAITGISGARVLTAHLSFVYSGYTYHKDFLIPSRFGA